MIIYDLGPALSHNSMTVRQLAVLLYLFPQKEKLSLRKVAHEIGIPKPGTCRAYDGLCRMGLIKRERSRNDMRDVYAILTEAGHKLAKQLTGKK